MTYCHTFSLKMTRNLTAIHEITPLDHMPLQHFNHACTTIMTVF